MCCFYSYIAIVTVNNLAQGHRNSLFSEVKIHYTISLSNIETFIGIALNIILLRCDVFSSDITTLTEFNLSQGHKGILLSEAQIHCTIVLSIKDPKHRDF